MSLSVVLVDDNAGLRQALSETIALFDDIVLEYAAPGGYALLQYLEQHQHLPDVVLMDIEMPDMDGIATTALVLERFPSCRVVMLSVFDHDDRIFSSILAGASGYLLKDERPERIRQAIIEAAAGGAPMSPSIAFKALQLLKKSNFNQSKVDIPTTASGTSQDTYDLTPREWEIVELLSQGWSYHQIAEKLIISPRTVRKHTENIYTKLRVHNKVEVAKLVHKHKWFVK
jgi:DNA-binding NarL/FixJ family response regulator